MGRLILDYDQHPEYYFSEVHYDSTGRRWVYRIQKDYSHYVPLYGPLLASGWITDVPSVFKFKVRKFVEDSLSGNVIAIKDRFNLSYKWCWSNTIPAYRHDPQFSTQSHWWWIIAFESLADATVFKLAFADYHRPVTPRPDDGPEPVESEVAVLEHRCRAFLASWELKP